MYRLLIVDDEPLVQIGLKSMLARDFPHIEVVGTASNGREGLALIESLRPHIVIADIKMPILTGLEMLAASTKTYGAIPVFIMLTAYEEFEMARQALSYEAAGYLVKIELNSQTLGETLERAVKRVDEHSDASAKETAATPSMEDFRQKFLLQLFDRKRRDKASLLQEAASLGIELNYDRFLVVYGQALQNSLSLYTSCLNMTREIIGRYAACHLVSNDIHHFTLVFYSPESQPAAAIMTRIQEGIEKVKEMILQYFNVSLRFGIGTLVSDVMDIPTSFEEAKTAEHQADSANPIRLFSHIVGSNRRSGKDKLISSIQEYIDSNLGGRLQLNEVAEAFGLSPAYLSVIFKKNADIGFSEYVYTRRIEKAREMLLAGDMKIYEVADALGFESAYYFSKVFKKVDGHSPTEYIHNKSEGRD